MVVTDRMKINSFHILNNLGGSGGEGRHERGTFYRLQELKKVEISLAEVHERVGKCTISVCKKAQKDWAHNQAVYLSKTYFA